MAISSVLNPQNIIGNRKGTAEQFQNFMTGGNGSLGSSIVNSTSLNKIVPFQRVGVKPITPDFNSIISTISTKTDAVLDKSVKNENNKVQGVVNNIQNVFQTTLQNFTKGYQQKLKSIEDSKPSKNLEKFYSLYNNVTGFIQFFVDKKNLNKTSVSLKGLKKLFEDSFETAKLIRLTINKIVKQLSNLPAATPFGGAGVFGGGRGKMLALGAGALGTGMLAGGAINALTGSENLQPAVVQQSVPKDLANSLSSIINRFSNAIDSLIKAAGGTPNSTSKTSGGGGKQQQKSPPKPPGSPSGPMPDPYDIPGLKVKPGSTGSLDKFKKELKGTPMEAEAESIYNTALAEGINPAFVLGLAGAESSFGSKGKAVGRNNPYNYGVHSNQTYSSYAEATQALARGLRDPKGYYKDKKTLPDIISTYAPSSENNVAQHIKNIMSIGSRVGDANAVFIPRGTKGGTIVPVPSPKQGQQTQSQVAAAPTQTKENVATILKQGNPQPKITTIKIPPKVSSVGGQSQGGGGGGGGGSVPSSPPSGGTPSVPFLRAGNVDNFLVLYSKMVYNIVDG